MFGSFIVYLCMVKFKDLVEEVYAECRRAYPDTFANVKKGDVYSVMQALQLNIARVVKTGSLLALRNFMLFRPNLKIRIKREQRMKQILDERKGQ